MGELGVGGFRVRCFVGGIGCPNGSDWRNFVGVFGTGKLGLANMIQGSAALVDYQRSLGGDPGSSEGLRVGD